MHFPGIYLDLVGMFYYYGEGGGGNGSVCFIMERIHSL